MREINSADVKIIIEKILKFIKNGFMINHFLVSSSSFSGVSCFFELYLDHTRQGHFGYFLIKTENI